MTYARDICTKILNWHYLCAFLPNPAKESGSSRIFAGIFAEFEKKRHIPAGAGAGAGARAELWYSSSNIHNQRITSNCSHLDHCKCCYNQAICTCWLCKLVLASCVHCLWPILSVVDMVCGRYGLPPCRPCLHLHMYANIHQHIHRGCFTIEACMGTGETGTPRAPRGRVPDFTGKPWGRGMP